MRKKLSLCYWHRRTQQCQLQIFIYTFFFSHCAVPLFNLSSYPHLQTYNHTVSIQCSKHTFPKGTKKKIGRSLWMNFNLFYMCLFNVGWQHKVKERHSYRVKTREKFKIVLKLRFRSQFLSDFLFSFTFAHEHSEQKKT